MRDSAYSHRASVTVAPVTRRIREIASGVKVGSDEGLNQPSVVNLDDITTLNKARIREQIGFLSEAKMLLVEEAIRFCLTLPAYRDRS
jgi:mRNA interferase MazF